MLRTLSAVLVAASVLGSTGHAQGPIQRAGQALDNAGRNIRRGVENGIARGQITAQERELVLRVTERLRWDKPLVSSALQVEVRADGMVILRGSVADEVAKKRAVDLVENTVGVAGVVDETAVVKEVKVIRTEPLPAAGAVPARAVETPRRVIAVPPAVVSEPAETRVITPAETKVIVKP